MNRVLRAVTIAAIVVSFALPATAHAYGAVGTTPVAASPTAPVELVLAYVDPGAAGFVIVTVLGFFAAIGYTARAYLSRMKQIDLPKQASRAGRRSARPVGRLTHRGAVNRC